MSGYVDGSLRLDLEPEAVAKVAEKLEQVEVPS